MFSGVSQSRVFRVFVSSTFSDMVLERNALQQRVFPKLRNLCVSRGFQFQPIDLRWGISQEASLNQRAVSVCMNEIKRCQSSTKRPNFIVLLGDRYGWQPLPETIPEAEFQQINDKVPNKDRRLLNEWYWPDNNAIPAKYILQPRIGRFVDNKVWLEIEDKLRTIIRHTVQQPDITMQMEGQTAQMHMKFATCVRNFATKV